MIVLPSLKMNKVLGDCLIIYSIFPKKIPFPSMGVVSILVSLKSFWYVMKNKAPPTSIMIKHINESFFSFMKKFFYMAIKKKCLISSLDERIYVIINIF